MSPLWLLLTLLPVLGGAERFNCKGRILGAYYADIKSGCKAFHVCVRVAGGGIRDFRFFCPPGTLFHQEAQTCTDWGDDDALACPTNNYDGQFDIYKIGSGYDTQKLSSPGNHDDEAEFGLQRAETGDRRLSQNNVAPNGASSDLRAAHSSDFFTGQRDRGRDDPAPPAPQEPPRQSFRRATTLRTTTTTVYTTPPPPPPPQPSSPTQFETSKRKLVRKRPFYGSTQSPTPTFPPNVPFQQPYSEKPQQNFNRRVPSQNRQTFTTPDLPPQYKEYKEEYVEVSRVTPKPKKYYPSNPTSTPFLQSTPASYFNKKDSLTELYNYDAQSTPGLKVQNENQPDFARTKKLNSNFNVRDTTTTQTTNYKAASRGTGAGTPAHKNYNSVSYESEKNNFVPYSKQNYFNSPSTVPPTSAVYTTTRPDPPANFNTVAYNTNIGFHAQSNNNYADNDDAEDDGQYRPPQGEDDGQYRPELYDRELLTGAHSLNIAASGNRLPEDQKPYGKTQPPPKVVSQTAAPRPFRPAPTPTSPRTQPTRAPETYPTTQITQTINTQRAFDYYQTYTTTSRPSDFPAQNVVHKSPARATTPSVPYATESRRTRAPSRSPAPPTPPTLPPTPAPRPTSRAPHSAKPSNKKEDLSYDYAYYDSDPGFSEYDQIEEFGKTKLRA